MKRVLINLATRPFRNNALWWAAFGAAFAFLTAFSWYNIHWYGAMGEEITSLRQVLGEREAELDAISEEVTRMNADLEGVDLKSLSERSASANAIILRRLFSWTQLFGRLEEVMPENVRLRSIRPAISREGVEVAVDGMAKDYESLLRFEEALSDSNHFATVYPLQETRREAQGEIHFNLVFGYLPEGKAARADLSAAQPASAPAGGTGGEGEVVPAPPAGDAEGPEPDAPSDEDDAPAEEGGP